MKSLIILITFLLSSSLNASVPTPQIFLVDPKGALVPTPISLTGQLPFQVHLSALPDTPANTCYWDPTSYRSDGEHVLCDFDKAALSLKNLPASSLPKYLNTDPTKLAHPQSIDINKPQICFVQPGITFDALTNALISGISSCVNTRNINFISSISQKYLGGGSLLKSTFEWDFGDPGSAYNQVRGFNASHIYDSIGKKTITLTVRNDAGLSGSSIFTLNATPNIRSKILINTDSDLPKIMNHKTSNANGDEIVLQSGATFHFTNYLRLNNNDWVHSSPGTPATITPITTNTIFNPQASNNTLVENINVSAESVMKGWLASGNGTNQAYRNIAFNHTHGGYSIGGSGVLIQNTGMADGANGAWNSNHIVGNFIIHSSKALSLYGNHVYLVKADANGEPAIRANAGHLISMIGNHIGGYTGKDNQVSVRGSPFVYFGNNEIRGGVFNVQNGVSQDPQPTYVSDTLVVERNTFENAAIQMQQGAQNQRYSENLIHMHSPSDPYNLLYPVQNYNTLNVGGPAMGLNQNHILINNNGLQFDPTGRGVVFYGAPNDVEFTNNRIISPLATAINTNGNSLDSFTILKGNTYYLNAKVFISDVTGLSTLAEWNAHTLASGNKIEDALALPAAAPMVGGEIQVPLLPTPSPLPTATPAPLPIKTISLECKSIHWVTTTCATPGLTQAISIVSMIPKPWCDTTWIHNGQKTGYSLVGNSIVVTAGCQGQFQVQGY